MIYDGLLDVSVSRMSKITKDAILLGAGVLLTVSYTSQPCWSGLAQLVKVHSHISGSNTLGFCDNNNTVILLFFDL